MKEEEFKKFMGVVDEAYPKQRNLNIIQKGFFWLALRDYSLEECIKAFSIHTQQSEWKPQVCDIINKLSDDTEIKKLLLDFFNRKEIKDETGIEVFRIMGGERLRRTCENDYEKIEEKFVELYKSKKTKEKFEELPNKVKQKLIGIEEKDDDNS
tara:strand:- start:364 stop:825 length:462 start_codon:yes stop_codon:yes gene_type:complete